MTLPIVVIGFGGHGRVVAAALIASGRKLIAVTDLHPGAVTHAPKYVDVITDEILLSRYGPGEVLLALGIGSIRPTLEDGLTRQAVKSFLDLGYRFTGLQHPAAWVASDAIVSPTAQIHAGAIVQAGATIGDFSILNTKSSIDHDCLIGSFCHIGPGATLSGNVSVGDGSHLGTGCNVIQGIRIGKLSFVAAGATVVRDVPDHDSVKGLPAKSFRPNHFNI
ncbi:MAG TPA: acetyltransferase [Pirellula sp.]|nr:acetyltransferase [Pirellula sp.]